MLAAQFSPGPDMLLLLKNSVNHPLRTGLFTVAGICLGLSIHTAVILLGLAAAFQAHAMAFRLFTLAGAAYLLWIASRLLLSLRRPLAPAAETCESGIDASLSAAAALRQGFLTNITNAKAFLFLAAFSASVLQESASPGRKGMLASIIVGQALIFWSLFVWLLQSRPLRALYVRSEQPLNAVFGLLLIYIAIRVILGG